MDEGSISGRLFLAWFKHRVEDVRGGFVLLNEDNQDELIHNDEMDHRFPELI